MKKIEVFLDIDGCFIDEKYQFNVPLDDLNEGLKKYFEIMNFNLNSNRSLVSIMNLWSQIKPNGLIVYENGQGIFNPVENIEEPNGKKFSRENLKKNLRGLCNRISFIPTDDLIKTPEKFESKLSREIYCEDTRRFTMTIYPRIISSGIPIEDLDYTLEVLERVGKKYSDSYEVYFSKKYGNIILTPKNALKSQPMKKIADGKEIASFGDEIPDIMMFRESSPGMVGCPANAKKEVKDFVKKTGGFVSEKPFTRGVLEFVEYLARYKNI